MTQTLFPLHARQSDRSARSLVVAIIVIAAMTALRVAYASLIERQDAERQFNSLTASAAVAAQ